MESFLTTISNAFAKLNNHPVLLRFIAGAIILISLYWLSIFNYLLFHSIAELFSIIIAASIVILAWNSRRFLENNYLLFLGLAFVFTGFIDLLHTLAFKGLGVFPLEKYGGANLAAQLWILARYFQSISFLVAPLFLTKKLSIGKVFALYTVATALALAAIFYWQIFPVAFVEGAGLTAFKIASEAVISLIFFGSLVLLVKNRKSFDARVVILLISGIVAAIFSEISFQLYETATDTMNFIGHIFKIVSFYFIYRAIIVTGFKNPYNLLFRNLKKSEETLRVLLNAPFNTAALIDINGKILAINESETENITEESQKIIGKNIYDFFTKENADFKKEKVAEAISSTKPVSFEDEQNGEYFENTVYPITDIYNPSNVEKVAIFIRNVTSRKKIETELGEITRQHERVLESAGEGIVGLDAKGRVLSINPAAEKMLGWTSGEIAGKSLHSLTHHTKPDGNKYPVNECPIFQVEVDKKMHRIENDFFWRKNGVNFPVEYTSTPIIENNVLTGIVIIFKDITERLAGEEQLKYQANLIESMSDGVFSVDLDLNIKNWNEGAEKLYGWKESEVLGQPLRNFINTEFVETARGTFYKKLFKENFWEGDVIQNNRNGEKLIIFSASSLIRDKNNNPIGILSVNRNVTEVRRSQELLAKEKAEDEALLSSIGDGIIAVDMLGKIKFINKALEKICGVRGKEIIGRDLDEAIPFWDERSQRVPKEERPIYIALNPQNKEVFPITTGRTFYCINAKTSRKVPLSSSASPIILDKKIMGAIVVWRDITREKEIDRAKDEFISFASHQLRTPLTSISLASELLLGNIAGDISKEQKKYLKLIYSSTKEMSDLIETLLNVSRIEMGTLAINLKNTELVGLVKKITQSFKMEATDKKIALKFVVKDKIPEIVLDERLLKLILVNLISNALKYSPAQSNVLVELKKGRKDIVIIVSDTGWGIPENQQNRVFEKLFHAESVKGKKTEGIGLGLYIAKAAVEQYGGTIWLKSPSNRAFLKLKRYSPTQKGTSFYVTIPIDGMRKEKA